MHDGQYPTIAKLARKYLAIPGSSAPSERVFSRAKLVQQRQRWNLLPQHLEACVMIKHNAWTSMVNYEYLTIACIYAHGAFININCYN